MDRARDEAELFHRDKVNRCCLVCGEFLKGQKYKFEDWGEDLQSTFNVNVNLFDEWHPLFFCKCCKTKMSKTKESESYKHTTEVMNWMPHKDDCAVCKKFFQKCKGGAKRKCAKGRGRPPKKIALEQNNLNLITSKSIFAQTRKPSMQQLVAPNTLILCKFCKEVLDDPVCGPCEHSFCRSCLLMKWQQLQQPVLCPECSCELIRGNISAPPLVLLQLIYTTKAHCQWCHNIYQLDELEKHEFKCTRVIETAMPSKAVTVSEVLLRKPNTPLTHNEQLLATKLIQRKIETERNKTIQLHTTGKVCSLFVYF